MALEDLYATRADLYRYGMPRGMLANPGRLCASVSADTSTFELDGHGFETDDRLLHRAEEGGSLPDPLEPGIVVFAIRDSDSTYRVAATAAGNPIELLDDGVSVVVSTELPIDDVIYFYSRFVDGVLIGHKVPLAAPIPIEVTVHVAELSAAKLLRIANQSSESMAALELGAKAQLERWAAGIPLRDARATLPTNLAYSEAVPTEARNWGNGGTLL